VDFDLPLGVDARRSFERRCKADGGARGQAFGETRMTGPTPGEEAGVSRSGQQEGAPQGSRRVGRWFAGSNAYESATRCGRPRRSAPSGVSRVGGKAREEAGKAKRPATQRSVEPAPKSNFRKRSQTCFR
jgi:hypothetical protein